MSHPEKITRLKIAVSGASGRMGQMLIEAITNDNQCELVGALEHSSSPALGRDAGALLGRNTGVTITADITAALADAQFLIDFTRPEATLEHLAYCEQNKLNWSSEQPASIIRPNNRLRWLQKTRQSCFQQT